MTRLSAVALLRAKARIKQICTDLFSVFLRLCSEKLITVKSQRRNVIISFIISYLMSCVNYSFSQNKTIDSLNILLRTDIHDTSKLNILFLLVENIYDDKVWPQYNQQALELAKKLSQNSNEKIKIKGKKAISSAYNNLGYLYNTQGKVKESLEFFLRCLKIQEEIGDQYEIATSLNNIGLIFKNKGQIKEALIYYNKSLLIREKIGDKKGIATTLNNIAVIYKSQGLVKKALEYNGRSLKIREEIGDKQGISYSLNNIGAIYDNQGQIKEALVYYGRSLKIQEEIGDKQGISTSLHNIGIIYKSQEQVKEALDFFNRSLKIREDIEDKQGIAYALNIIGEIYDDKNQLKEAIDFYGRSLKIQEELGNAQGIAYSYNCMGSIYFKEKKYVWAKEYADKSLYKAKELGYPESIRNVAKLYSNIYKATGNYKSGWEMFELYVQMRDSVKNKENEKAAIRQQTKYEFEKALIVKEQEEKEERRREGERVNRRNNLQYSGILIGLLLVFGSVFMLGKFNLPVRVVEVSVFMSFLLLFEFTLVFLDPFLDNLTGGVPLLKLFVNAIIAGIIFPVHGFFERLIKRRLLKSFNPQKQNSKCQEESIEKDSKKNFNFFCLMFFYLLFVILNTSFQINTPTKIITKVDSLLLDLQTANHDTTKLNILFELVENIYDDKLWSPYNEQALILAKKLSQNNNKKIREKGKIGIADAFNNLGFLYDNQGNIKGALEYYNKSLKIQEKIGDKQGIANSLNNIGFIYENQGQIKEALNCYNRSLKLREEIGDKPGIANSLNNIGMIYSNLGQIKEALVYFVRSLKIRESAYKGGDKHVIAHSLNNIGMIYNNQGQQKEALDYFNKSLKIQEEINDKEGIAYSLNNIGFIYTNLGQIKEALDYYGRSLKIRENIGDKEGVATSLNNIGSIYKNDGQIKKAMDYFLKSLKIREEIKDKLGMATSFNNIGNIFLKNNVYNKAKAYADSSMELANELGFPENIRNAAKLNADIYKATNNYKSGWEMFELYVQMRDSVKNNENEKAAIQQQTKYEFEKVLIVKEQEEKDGRRREGERVNRRNNLQYSGILIGLLLVFGSVFMLGKFNLPVRVVEVSVFMSFLLLFEFTLVFLDPFLDNFTGGEPIFKLLVNAVIAGIIFPLHVFFEQLMKRRLLKSFKS